MDDPFQFDTDHSLHPGQVFLERYTLVKFLGRGGMGQVWLVRDAILGEEIALKFLPSEIMVDRAALEDLKRETLRSRKLSHPHIVKVYDFTAANKSGAISMEYVSGGTLADLRYDQPGMVMDATDPRFATWMHQLAGALAYAHDSVGIVHRDLKPQNLMLDGQGNLKLADFGVARSLTDSMSRLSRQNAGSSGTHIYMSPQQAQGMAPSAADDIYAYGATLYELLTGKPPFFRGNIQHQIDSVEPEPMHQRRAELAEDVVPLPPIPAFWETLVARCLNKQPSERPASMKEIMESIATAGQDASSEPSNSSATQTARSQSGERDSPYIAKEKVYGVGSENLKMPSDAALNHMEWIDKRAATIAICTGFLLVCYLVIHLYGCLVFLMGRDPFNSYIHDANRMGFGLLIWIFRIILITVFASHVTCVMQMALKYRRSHKEGRAQYASGEARSLLRMIGSGAVVLIFVVYHLIHFKFRLGNKYNHSDAYWFYHEIADEWRLNAWNMVVDGFSWYPASLFYVVAMVSLAVYLVQASGFAIRYFSLRLGEFAGPARRFSVALIVIICLGFASIPLSIVLGIIR